MTKSNGKWSLVASLKSVVTWAQRSNKMNEPTQPALKKTESSSAVIYARIMDIRRRSATGTPINPTTNFI